MALSGWEALILGAGAGRRFGGAKLLAPIAGVPVIRRTAEAVAAVGFGTVHVVSGAHHAGLADALEGLDCRIVDTPDWHEGMAASIRRGVAVLAPEAKGVFLFLGDMPLVPTGLCGALAALAEQKGFAARPMVSGKPGHPVCFVSAALDELGRLEGDQGAGPLLKRRSTDVAYLETNDAGAIIDIDDAEGLAAAERAWKSRMTSAISDSAMARGALPKP